MAKPKTVTKSSAKGCSMTAGEAPTSTAPTALLFGLVLFFIRRRVRA
jgi:MYXO-CTERM domain-containing protein